ncbi:MAG TPA: hypothetical protein PLT92_13750, partial [Ignavibacteriaceae bacterium]|nr:hypothetical protein [Ignavibacteriaceae bacterium]
YNSVNDLFKIYTEGEGVWLTFLFADRSYSNPSWLTSLAWSKISSKPTTLSGYGITDGVSTSGSYSDPSWLTSLAWSKISSKPTTLSGYGITNGMIWGGESTSDPISPGSGTVYYNSVNDLFKIYTEGEGVWLTFLFADRSYSNPSWLTSLAWSKISSKPTTLSGYGITDGVYWRGEAISDPSSPGSGTVYYNSVNDQYKIYTEGEGAWLTFLFSERTYSNPAWLSSLAETKISFTDVTTGNASSSMHGFLPKLANTGTKFLRDDGTWQTAGTGDVSSSGNNEYSGTNAYNNDVKFSDDWIRTPEAGTLTSWGGSYALDVSGKNFIELNPAGNRTLIYLTDEGSIDGQIVTIQNISSYDITINEDDNILFAGTITSMVLKQYGSATFRYRQTGNYWICIAAYPGT